MRLTSMLATIVAFVPFALAGDLARAEPPIAITHVHVVPMDKDVVLDDQTVVIADGRIQALGGADKVRVPDGAREIDGSGKWLMPGLADMHVHAWMESDLLCFVANGVTTVRNMFGAPLHVAWKKEIAAGDRLGPRIYTAGPIIDGDPPVWPGSDVLTDPERADALVIAQQEAGYDFLKCYSMLKAEPFDALCAAAKKHGMRVMGHVPASVSLDHAIDVGQESIEHFTGLVDQCQADDSPMRGHVNFFNEAQAWKHVDDAKITLAAKHCAKVGAWNCPTLVVMQKWAKGKEAEALLARPEMRYVDPQLKQYWGSSMMYLSGMADSYLATSHAADADRARTVKLFHDAGAPLIAGTDMGNPYVVAGWSLHEELADFQAVGLTPYETLRAATADAARFLHAESEWGTVAPGLAADLILVEANPLADVANAAKRTGVVVHGKWFTESELHEKLEKVAADYPPAPKNEKDDKDDTDEKGEGG